MSTEGTTGETTQLRQVSWMQFPGVRVLIAGFGQAFMGYGWYYYGWTVFVRIFQKEMGFSAALIGLLSSVGRITSMVANPVGGWIVDNFGPRWGTMGMMLLLGLSFIGLAVFTEYWHLFVIYSFAMLFVGGGGLYRMSYTAANRWWMDRRAFAVAAISLGGGLGGVIMLPPIAVAMDVYGFRMTAWIAVVTILIIAVPIAFLYPSHMPEAYGMYVDNTSPETRAARAQRRQARPRPMLADITTGQALRSWCFWMLVVSGLWTAFAGAPISIFQNMRMGALGYSRLEAAVYYSYNNICTYIGRFGVMFLGDWFSERIPVRFNMAAIYIIRCVGFVIFALGSEPWHFMLWALIHGSSFGASVPYMPVLMGAYFGRQAFGTIYGLRVGLSAAGGMISPVLSGWIADTAGWELAFMVIAGGYLLGALFIILATPPKEQTRELAA